MKQQVQAAGVRKWFGDDFINLQTELTDADIALISDFNTNCILSGVKVTANGGNWDVSAGLVYLLDATGANGKICRVDAETNITLPIYYEQETLDKDDVAAYGRVYKDAVNKDIINEYHAKSLAAAPGHAEYLTITSADSANVRFKDVLRLEFNDGRKAASLDIGAWDMESSVAGNATFATAHLLSVTEYKTMRNVLVMIRDDVDSAYKPLDAITSDGTLGGGVDAITSTNINLVAVAGGVFDSSGFNATVSTRGYITFDYIPD